MLGERDPGVSREVRLMYRQQEIQTRWGAHVQPSRSRSRGPCSLLNSLLRIRTYVPSRNDRCCLTWLTSISASRDLRCSQVARRRTRSGPAAIARIARTSKSSQAFWISSCRSCIADGFDRRRSTLCRHYRWGDAGGGMAVCPTRDGANRRHKATCAGRRTFVPGQPSHIAQPPTAK
jgi:hypothetical protein